VNWQAADFVPGHSRDTGVKINGFNFNTVDQYNYTLQNFDSYSETGRTKSDSINLNLELRYNSGPFKRRCAASMARRTRTSTTAISS
jgi:hypothetical protein